MSTTARRRGRFAALLDALGVGTTAESAVLTPWGFTAPHPAPYPEPQPRYRATNGPVTPAMLRDLGRHPMSSWV